MSPWLDLNKALAASKDKPLIRPLNGKLLCMFASSANMTAQRMCIFDARADTLGSLPNISCSVPTCHVPRFTQLQQCSTERLQQR
jgi:hypothetical protein